MSGFIVTSNVDKALAKVRENLDIAQALLSEQVLHDSNRFVPVDTSALHDSGQLEDSETIVWQTDYARYVWEMDGVNWTDPNKRGTEPHGHWFETARERNFDKWRELVARTIEGEKVSMSDTEGI